MMNLNLSLAELQALGRQWGTWLPAGTVLLLWGELGAGKNNVCAGLSGRAGY